MWWKHRKFNSEANWLTSKLNKQQTEDYSTINSRKCWKHQKENQCKANDRKFANLAEDAINNKIYLYKMLTTNLLQAMLVRKAEQSHQHQQSSNSVVFTYWAHTQLKSEIITM